MSFQADREKFIKAANFLKPAIMKADEEESSLSKNIREKTHVHARIDGDKCQLTAFNGHCGKRVILEKPAQLELIEETKIEIVRSEGNVDISRIFNEFLIPRETFEGYVELCKKHKAMLEKTGKKDASVKRIEIGPHSLDSHKDENGYHQPVGVTFPNIDHYFYAPKDPISEIWVDSQTVIDAMKEFNNHVGVAFSGDGGPVYMWTEDMTYQAFFLPEKSR